MKHVKLILAILCLALGMLAIALTGCARFSTTQTDTSYAYTTNGATITATPTRTITTKVSAWTCLDASSELAKFKATQTDKTQTASVGSLNQQATLTNVVTISGNVVDLMKMVK